MVVVCPPTVHDRRPIAGSGVVDRERHLCGLAKVNRWVDERIAKGSHLRMRLLLLGLLLLLSLLLLLLELRRWRVVRRSRRTRGKADGSESLWLRSGQCSRNGPVVGESVRL